MIRVDYRPEPPSFCESVRMKGLRALACQIGLNPPYPLPGPLPAVALPPARVAEVHSLEADVLAARLPTLLREVPTKMLKPYWTGCLETLGDEYGGMCAYLGMLIWRSTGLPTVDHFVPKQSAPLLAYEWSNFRYAAHLVNTLKSVGAHIDPLHIEDGWFVLDEAGFGEVIPNPELAASDPDLYAAVDHTIETLHLNDTAFVKDRVTLIEWSKDVECVACVRKQAPFVYRECVRHGWAVEICL